MRKLFTLAGAALLFAASAFAAETVPWSNDFSNYSNSISGWVSSPVLSQSKGFTVSSGMLYLAQGVNNQNYPIPNNVYLFFTGDGFLLEAGKSYRFDMNGKTNATPPNNDSQQFQILLYKYSATPNYNAAHTTILEGGKLPMELVNYAGYFEVEETGVYQLCLHAQCAYAARAMYFDDFRLIESSMDAPAKGSIEVTPDPTGVLKGDVKVTAPTKTIRGNNLTSMTKLNIVRDGGVIKEVENPSPGQVITLSDNVAQPGTHWYSVQGFNEKGGGETLEISAVIGGTPEKRSWLNNRAYIAKYTPEGKIRIEWPATAGVTDYKIETLSGRVVSGTPEAFTVFDYYKNADIDCYYIIDDAFTVGEDPIGWQYKVSKLDASGNATKVGTTNYVCLNNNVPYFPTMRSDTSLDAFTLDNDYEYGWQYSSGGGGHIQAGLSRPYGATEYFYKNWLISPGINLSKDKFYRVKATCGSDNGMVTYTIKAGKGSSRDDLDIVVTEDHPTVKTDSNLGSLETDEMFLSVPDDGMYFIGMMCAYPSTVYSTNFRMTRFDIIEVDPTLPNAPTDVRVAYSPTGSSDGKIYFKVPEKAINGDDVSGINKIEVYKDGELFATLTEGLTPGAELSFDVTVTAGQQNVYSIRAFNAAGQGEAASATVFVLSTPYSNDFSTKNSLNGFTMINNLNTPQNFHLQFDQVRLFYDEHGNDHWLITPPVTLTAGQYYQLNYNIKADDDEAGHCAVFLGKAPTADALDQVITEEFELNKENNIFNGLHEEWFTVEENGQYFLGFHVTKPEGRHTKEIYFDDLNIAQGVAGTVPSHGVLKVTPAPDGALTAQLTYTVPDKSLNGSALNANSTQDVYFYINGVQTGGIMPDGTPNPTTRTFKAYPGQTVSINVAVDEELPYIFGARTAWNGPITYVDAFVGINTPAYPDPSSIKLIETQPYGHVKLSWDAVTKDIEGYDMNPDNVHYEVAYLTTSPTNPNNYVEQAVLTDIVGTSCEFDAIDKDAPQTMKRYILRARNIKGKGSNGVFTPYINVGKPYRMPYQETFSTKDNEPGVKTAIFDEVLEGLCHWGLMYDGLEKGVTSADGDGCYLAMESAFLESKGRFYTGKVNLGNGENPALTVMLYNPATDGGEARNSVEFLVYTYADDKWHSLGEPRSVAELCNYRSGWNKVTYDLSDYIDNVIMCAIEVTCNQHTFTSFDNIRVWETPRTDLSLFTHSAPVSVVPGALFDVDVNVVNSGLDASTPDAIDMYVDDELVSTIDGTEIAPGESGVYTFTHTFPVVDLAPTHNLRFVVNLDGDSDPTDNELTATVATIDADLPMVENLTATTDDDNNVTLSWDTPSAIDEGPITETFETWQAGDANRKGWTSYDGDKRPIVGINNGNYEALPIPGLTAFEPASFAVVDNAGGVLPANSFPANSGTKFLLSLIPTGGTGSADDWFISPLLSGEAQTISFYTRNFGNYRAGIEVLYSDGGMTVKDFKSLFVSAVGVADWTKASIDLPEGATRFAIRNISYCEESYMLMIDDITFEGAKGDNIALLGYNIYRENEHLAKHDMTAYTHAEPLEEGKHVFGVSARYAHGESKILPIEVTVESGITTISEAEGVHVFGGSGCIHITGADGMNVTVYDIAGHMLTNGAVPASGRIAAAGGVYIVVIGNETFKVVVK